MTDITDSNRKAEINSTNMELAEFGVHIIIFLIDSIYKTCCKWAIDDFIKYCNNDPIMSLIINIGAESAIHIKELLTICHCHINKLNCLNIGNINDISEDIILLR